MDQKDLYQQMKNAFLLGNHFKVFEFLKTYPLDDQPNLLYKEEICSIVVRSALALEDRRTQEITAVIEENQDLSILYHNFEPFLSILLQVFGNENEVNKAIKELEKVPNPAVKKILQGYFGLQTRSYNLGVLVELVNSSSELEAKLLVVLLLLKINQFSLAEAKKKKMSQTDDEDLATHLAHIYILIYIGKIEDAIFLIDETKEKFQDSLKLLNLKAACLIALKQYDNAKVMLEKLLTIVTNKAQYRDKQETEICLNNLVVLSMIQGLPYEEYLKQLPATSAFSRKYANASKLFDSLVQAQE